MSRRQEGARLRPPRPRLAKGRRGRGRPPRAWPPRPRPRPSLDRMATHETDCYDHGRMYVMVRTPRVVCVRGVWPGAASRLALAARLLLPYSVLVCTYVLVLFVYLPCGTLSETENIFFVSARVGRQLALAPTPTPRARHWQATAAILFCAANRAAAPPPPHRRPPPPHRHQHTTTRHTADAQAGSRARRARHDADYAPAPDDTQTHARTRTGAQLSNVPTFITACPLLGRTHTRTRPHAPRAPTQINEGRRHHGHCAFRPNRQRRFLRRLCLRLLCSVGLCASSSSRLPVHVSGEQGSSASPSAARRTYMALHTLTHRAHSATHRPQPGNNGEEKRRKVCSTAAGVKRKSDVDPWRAKRDRTRKFPDGRRRRMPYITE
jgi:hypothetical protein